MKKLISLVMLLLVMPFTVSAETVTVNSIESLKAALSNGDSVIFETSIIGSITIGDDYEGTIDLATYTLTGTDGAVIDNEGTVIIKNGSIVVGTSGTYAILNDGEMTLDSIVASSTNMAASLIRNGSDGESTYAKLTIKSGTYTGGLNNIINDTTASLIINGGTFKDSSTTSGTATILNYGNLEITDGDFTAPSTAVHVLNLTSTSSNVISGGTFNGIVLKQNLTISGGSFTTDISSCLDAGFVVEYADPYYVVSVNTQTSVASIGSVVYDNIETALNAAKDGDVVELLKDAVLGGDYDLETSITLNMNNNTISGGKFEISNSAIVIINDGYFYNEVGNTIHVNTGTVTLNNVSADSGIWRALYVTGTSTVVVNGGDFETVNTTSLTVASIHIGSNLATLTLNGEITTEKIYVQYGTLTISEGAVVENLRDSINIISSGTLINNGTLINDGYFKNLGILTNNGTVVVNSQSDFETMIEIGGNITISKTEDFSKYEITSLEIVSGQTLTIEEGVTLTIGEDITLTNNGTIINNGTIVNTGKYTGTGTLTVESEVKLTADSAIVTDSETLQSIINDVIASNSALANLVLSAEGDVTLDLTVGDITTESADTEVKAAMHKITTSTDNTIVSFFDVSLYLTDGTNQEYVSSLTKEITIQVAIPEGLDAVEDGLVREYYILRNHEGEITEIKGTVSEDGTYVTFTTDQFSTYALSFIDAEVVVDTDIVNPATGDAILVSAVIGGLSLIAIAGVAIKLKRN